MTELEQTGRAELEPASVRRGWKLTEEQKDECARLRGLGWKLQDLADRYGISPQSVHRLTTGHRKRMVEQIRAERMADDMDAANAYLVSEALGAAMDLRRLSKASDASDAVRERATSNFLKLALTWQTGVTVARQMEAVARAEREAADRDADG